MMHLLDGGSPDDLPGEDRGGRRAWIESTENGFVVNAMVLSVVPEEYRGMRGIPGERKTWIFLEWEEVSEFLKDYFAGKHDKIVPKKFFTQRGM